MSAAVLSRVTTIAGRYLMYRVLGYLLLLLSAVQLLGMLVAIFYHESIFWVFLTCAVMGSVVGYFLVYKGRHANDLKSRQLFLLTTLSWLMLCFFAAIPIWWIVPNCSFTDAWFEAVSAVTTTGSTVFAGLDQMPKGLLFWRAVLNWIGGIGIIVMAIAILPALKIGGMRLFKTENSDTSEKILPRSSSMSAAIGGVYLVLSALTMLSYYVAGYDGF